MENAAIGSAVLMVKALSNVNGHIGYFIRNGDDRKQFRIDFYSGK